MAVCEVGIVVPMNLCEGEFRLWKQEGGEEGGREGRREARREGRRGEQTCNAMHECTSELARGKGCARVG